MDSLPPQRRLRQREPLAGWKPERQQEQGLWASHSEILIPELDARQNATINVIDSIVHDAGGNSIVKSYYNGKINISGNSVVHTMQVTTMGTITVSGAAKLNATWQTNVYGNGMITVENGATFATAALHLTGEAYKDRDNTMQTARASPQLSLWTMLS